MFLLKILTFDSHIRLFLVFVSSSKIAKPGHFAQTRWSKNYTSKMPDWPKPSRRWNVHKRKQKKATDSFWNRNELYNESFQSCAARMPLLRTRLWVSECTPGMCGGPQGGETSGCDAGYWSVCWPYAVSSIYMSGELSLGHWV